MNAMTSPWLAPHATRLAELAPLDPMARVRVLDAWAREGGLRTESGRPLRFVADTADGPRQAASVRPAYEARIFEAGEVATRTDPEGARHDLFNALAWLVWPHAKARLNALHAAVLAAAASPTGATDATAETAATAATAATGAARGPLRDAATLFDENAALWIGLDTSLEDALRAFDWNALFVAGRARVERSVRVHAFGHALLEKLDAPFKAITAHAWPLRLAADTPLADVDRALARSLEPGRLGSRAFCPLPVMGVPGWCDANRDPAFYNDAAVFRSGRRRPPPA
ncbi:MAG: DUF3025 domain-containing protein [Burkholderiales bacterium]|nr:MAG: DUF3025 domain-containing protein [Burkholderiales bacterium]